MKKSLKISRRGLLTAGLYTPFILQRLRVASILVGGAGWSARAVAEPVTTCIAIGTAVASAVASHNRTDGGMGAIAQATLEYQRILSSQLASLQLGMTEVLERLNNLPAEVQKRITQARIDEVNATIGAC